MFCLLCRKPTQPVKRLCPICQLLLDSIRSASSSEGFFRTLFSYEEPLRTLILRSKVKNDFVALRFLRDLVLDHRVTCEAVAWADAVMAAPSSLWGRVRGRFDIAGYLAAEIAQAHKKQFLLPPLKVSFRWQKRAMLEKISVEKVYAPEQRDIRPTRRLLLFDDIATTGFTMTQLANELKSFDIKILTIASAKLPV